MSSFTVKINITNFENVLAFANKIQQMPECKFLTSDEIMKIICAYPIKIGII